MRQRGGSQSSTDDCGAWVLPYTHVVIIVVVVTIIELIIAIHDLIDTALPIKAVYLIDDFELLVLTSTYDLHYRHPGLVLGLTITLNVKQAAGKLGLKVIVGPSLHGVGTSSGPVAYFILPPARPQMWPLPFAWSWAGKGGALHHESLSSPSSSS
ncbi:hypothetical protein V8E36_007056 [Tilletia maclaganii]